MVKVLKATTRAEEYELRAKHFKDDHQLSGDGPRDSDFRIGKVLRLVSFSRDDKVLDISSGKGLLFERIHDKVAECCGRDVAPSMVERTMKKFAGYKNVSFTCGPSSVLPYPDNYFDKVLMTGAFCLQETKEECLQTLSEIRRVAKDSASIFISDISIVDESNLPPEELSPARRITRRLKQDGILGFPISLGRFIVRKSRELLEIEPVLIPSDHGIWFPDHVFVEMCRQNRLSAKGFPTELITGTSRTRWDYLIKPIEQA